MSSAAAAVRYGDLREVVMAAKDKGMRMRYMEQLQCAKDIASGMQFIEAQRMIHMDLALRNILLGEDNLTKIADFGLTRELPAGKE